MATVALFGVLLMPLVWSAPQWLTLFGLSAGTLVTTVLMLRRLRLRL
jgi:uncharacterized protein (DUF983 family)